MASEADDSSQSVSLPPPMPQQPSKTHGEPSSNSLTCPPLTENSFRPDRMERTVNAVSPKQHDLLLFLSTRLVHQRLLEMNMRFTRIKIRGYPHIAVQILHSDNMYIHTGPLLIIVQAGEVSRAGVWTPRLLMRGEVGLLAGSQLEIVEQAHAAGFAVAVINTNDFVVTRPGSTTNTRPTENESLKLIVAPNPPSSSNLKPASISVNDLTNDNRLNFVPGSSNNLPSSSSSVEEITKPKSTNPCYRKSIDYSSATPFKTTLAEIRDAAEQVCEVNLEERFCSVWKQLLPLCASQNIFIWAHQYGGACLLYPLCPLPITPSYQLPHRVAFSPQHASLVKTSPVVSKEKIRVKRHPSRRRHASAAAVLVSRRVLTGSTAAGGKRNLASVSQTKQHLQHMDVQSTSSHSDDSTGCQAPEETTPPPVKTRRSSRTSSNTFQSQAVISEEQHIALSTPKPSNSMTLDGQLHAAWHQRATRYWSDIRSRVKGIVFTDVANMANLGLKKVGWGLLTSAQISRCLDNRLPTEVLDLRQWFHQNSIHYVAADAPIGTRIAYGGQEATSIQTKSAGTTEHERIPHAVGSAVLKFFCQRLAPPSTSASTDGEQKHPFTAAHSTAKEIGFSEIETDKVVATENKPF